MRRGGAVAGSRARVRRRRKRYSYILQDVNKDGKDGGSGFFLQRCDRRGRVGASPASSHVDVGGGARLSRRGSRVPLPVRVACTDPKAAARAGRTPRPPRGQRCGGQPVGAVDRHVARGGGDARRVSSPLEQGSAHGIPPRKPYLVHAGQAVGGVRGRSRRHRPCTWRARHGRRAGVAVPGRRAVGGGGHHQPRVLPVHWRGSAGG
mmetsp:Transcript_38497/g.95603  ORF Transcript_38497/g.95603 Transcript_38497/m.95603 type:complete len:206 (-) Transcript_38497:1252-1869(-)